VHNNILLCCWRFIVKTAPQVSLFHSFIHSFIVYAVINTPETSQGFASSRTSQGFASNRSYDDDEEYGPLPETLQNFLSNVGVLTQKTSSSVASLDDHHHSHHDDGLIFESSFDLTEERLKHVFEMFDTDQDGLISYESMKRGLELGSSSSSGNLLDETGFRRLVEHLDADRSGDISYEEFTDGIRLLMLRRLVLSSPPIIVNRRHHHHPEEGVHVQVMDYNATRLERYILNNNNNNNTNGRAVKDEEVYRSTTREIGVADFYFNERPGWVKTRWINVSGTAAAASTLKRLSIKYMLHPLALEDALSPESHRPKAEVYSSRK
jgi:hypothetical protein